MNRKTVKELTGLTMREVNEVCERLDLDVRHGYAVTSNNIAEDGTQIVLCISGKGRKCPLLAARSLYRVDYYFDSNLNIYFQDAITRKYYKPNEVLCITMHIKDIIGWLTTSFVSFSTYASLKHCPLTGIYTNKTVIIDGLEVSEYARNERRGVEYCSETREYHLIENMALVETESFNYEGQVRFGTTRYVSKQYLQDHPEKYVKCDVCGAYHVPTDTGLLDGKNVCKKCAPAGTFLCSHCHEFHDISEKIEISDSYDRKTIIICKNCFETNSSLYGKCDHCGTYYLKSSGMLSTDYRGKQYCRNCVGRSVGSYHYFSRNNYVPLSLENENTDLYFGTEVETQGPTINACSVSYDNADLFHCERDGSIGDGFEIISQPMSMGFVKANYQRIADLFNGLSDAGQRSDQTSVCGLHVHVSRKAFKDNDAIYRAIAMVTFFKRNCETIARRTDGYYYSYGNINGVITKEKIQNKSNEGHGVSVNIQNTNTIEFRIFKGSLNPKTYMATIEFVNNIVAAANSGKNRIKFSELLVGDYLPEYVENRIARNHPLDKDQVIDFSGYNQEAVKAKFKKKWDLIRAIKAYNADPENINKISAKQLGLKTLSAERSAC